MDLNRTKAKESFFARAPRSPACRLLAGLLSCGALAENPLPASAAEWHVTPTGAPGGDGSSAMPWDLATAALGASGKILPGDTIWIHGGTYGNGGNQPINIQVNGAQGQPITVRAVRGERATIDGGVVVNGAWITLWGLEISNSSTQRNVTSNVGDPNARLGGVNLYSRGDRAINLVVHDTGHPAIGFWAGPGDGAEVYGSVLWGNGIYDPSPGYNGAPRGNGTYAQNQNGDRYIVDNVSFRNWTEGLDAHSAGSSYVNGFHFQGNIVFDNPTAAITTNTADPNNPMQRLFLDGNCTYRRATDNAKMSIGLGYYNNVNNDDVTITNNYFVLGSDDDRAFHVKLWKRATITDNTIVSQRYFGWWWNGAPGEVVSWDRNRYFGGNSAPFIYGPSSNIANGMNFLTPTAWKQQTGFDAASMFSTAAPTGLHVCKRPNKYESDRAFIAVYNWDHLPMVDLDLSDLLSPGDVWQLIDVQNYYAPPIASGTFTGPTVQVPMNLAQIAMIRGNYTHWTQQHTAPEFAVFELRADGPLRPTDDGGTGGGSDGGTDMGGSVPGGCSCNLGGGGPPSGIGALAAVLFFLWRRRRRVRIGVCA